LLLLTCVEHPDPDGVQDKDKLLWDQFLENLKDLQLGREIKRWARDHPTKNFQQIREELQCWVDKDSTPKRRTALARPQQDTRLVMRLLVMRSRVQPICGRW